MNNYIDDLTNKYYNFIKKYKPDYEFISRWFDIITENKGFIVCLNSDFSIMIFESKLSRRAITYLLNNENFDFGIQVDYYGIGNLKFYYDEEEHLRIYNKKVGSYFMDATRGEIKRISEIIDYLEAILDEKYNDVFCDSFMMHYAAFDNNKSLCVKSNPLNKTWKFQYEFKKKIDGYSFSRTSIDATYIDLFYYEFPMLSSKRNEYIYPFVLCISDSLNNVMFYVLDYEFKEIETPVLEILSSIDLGQSVYVSNAILYEKIKKTLNNGSVDIKHIPLSAESYCTFSSLEYNLFRYLHEKGDLFVEELSKVFSDINSIYEYYALNAEEDGYIDKYLFETSNKYLYDLYINMQKYDLKDIWSDLENNFSIRIADAIPEPSQDDEEEQSDDESCETYDKFEESNIDNDDVISDLLN